MPVGSVLENGVAPPLLGSITADLPVHRILKAGEEYMLKSPASQANRVLRTHVKYTRRVEIAVPASSAAESTSMFTSVHTIVRQRSDAQLYLAQNGKYRLRITYCDRKPIMAQGT